MDAAEERFEIPRTTRRESFLLAAGLLVICAVNVGIMVAEWPRRAIDTIAYLGAALAFAAGAASMIRYGRTLDRYAVVVSPGELRIGGTAIRWSDVDQLRVRNRLGSARIDLLGNGRRLGWIHPEIDDRPRLMYRILQRVELERRALPRHVASPHPAVGLALIVTLALVLIACGWWVALNASAWLGWTCVAGMAWFLISDLRTTLRRIDFDESGMRLRTSIGQRVLSRAEIRGFDMLTMSKEIYTVVELGDGRHLPLKVEGVDPFLVYETARRAYPELVT